jgi:Domain of unknown function (DUF4032)/Lipopolysaccharide kinase (Kdo/WaaP) family
MAFRLTTRLGHPTFMDLPWEQPLEEWEGGRLVVPVRGISRHIVRFAAYGATIYALKELPQRIAEREYRLLRELDERLVPVVEAVGLVTGRADALDEPLAAVLITKHLDFSLPYRSLFARGRFQELWNPLLDALAQLLVRLHLAGFFWGDCSLSNTLFRRDAGLLAATLVDAETGELHASLSDGQRAHDLEIAELNVAGEMLDLAIGGGWEDEVDVAALAEDLIRRYKGLWDELTRTEVLPASDRRAVERRVRNLNELGFDVPELVLEPADDGNRVIVRTAVVESGHHPRRLLSLTGLDVQENQARRLLNDVLGYKAWLEDREGLLLAEPLAALRWLTEVFEPAIAAVPADLMGKLEPAEMFHQILEHRWYLSAQRGTGVSTEDAVADYVDTVLHALPDERSVVMQKPASSG